jgi:hypothetical protein
MVVAAALMLLASPAQAAVIAQVTQLSTGFTPNGHAVRLIGQVTCDPAYRVESTRAVLEQPRPDLGTTTRRSRIFTDQVDCTGSPDGFTLRFHRPTPSEWVEGPATLTLSVSVCPDSTTTEQECVPYRVTATEETHHYLEKP